MYDVDLYLNNSKEGKRISELLRDNKISVTFVAEDVYEITELERWIYMKNDDILSLKNVTLLTTEKIKNRGEVIFPSFAICSALEKNNSYQRNREFNGSKYFLTLNGTEKHHRSYLYGFLNSNSNIKNKSLNSFLWKGISPDIKNPKNPHIDMRTKNSQYDWDNLQILYNSCMFEVVTESYSTLITEKTFKPILYGVPFLYFMKNYRNGDIYKYNEGLHDIDSYYGNSTLNLINMMRENYDVDVNYFNVDYTDSNGIENKIKELCSLSFDEIQTKYSDSFEKAEKNKKIITDYLNKIYEKIR